MLQNITISQHATTPQIGSDSWFAMEAVFLLLGFFGTCTNCAFLGIIATTPTLRARAFNIMLCGQSISDLYSALLLTVTRAVDLSTGYPDPTNCAMSGPPLFVGVDVSVLNYCLLAVARLHTIRKAAVQLRRYSFPKHVYIALYLLIWVASICWATIPAWFLPTSYVRTPSQCYCFIAEKGQRVYVSLNPPRRLHSCHFCCVSSHLHARLAIAQGAQITSYQSPQRRCAHPVEARIGIVKEAAGVRCVLRSLLGKPSLAVSRSHSACAVVCRPLE